MCRIVKKDGQKDCIKLSKGINTCTYIYTIYIVYLYIFNIYLQRSRKKDPKNIIICIYIYIIYSVRLIGLRHIAATSVC